MPNDLFQKISEALKGGYQGTILPDSGFTAPMEEEIRRRAWEQRGFGVGGQSDELQALIDALNLGGAGGAGGGYGGGYGGAGAIPWGSTQGAAELAQQFALEQLAKESGYSFEQLAQEAGYETEAARLRREWEAQQAELGRTFEAGEAEKQREFERQRALEELKAERQRIFAEMRGKDPVRAALFAMGVGGELLPGGERFVDLPPLAGAEAYGRQAATGLSKLTGGQVGVGARGVTGLPEIYKAAGAYSAGQRPGGAGRVGDIEAARTLLLSGYGVGGLGPEKQILGGPGAVGGMRGRPGISPEEALRKIQSVTPTGAAFR